MGVKMVFDPLYDLVVYMPFARDEDHIVFLCQGTCRLDGCGTVFDYDGAAQLLFAQTGCHVIQNVFRLFVTGVVGSENQLLAAALGDLCHHGAFALVAVSAATYDGNEFGTFFLDLADGLYHVVHGIRRMGIVHDRRPAFGAADRLKAAVHGCERAQHTQHFQFVKAEA